MSSMLLAEMQEETDSIEYNSPFPEGIEIEKWEMSGSSLDVYFNVNYNKMESATKVLLRAAIIQTLTQIPEIEYVAFYAAGQPVTDGQGNAIGYQSNDDFVQNIGSTLHSYQKGELLLYFANKDGTKLKGEKVSVRYNSNISMEKLIVEELIDGPRSLELQATFSDKTKLLLQLWMKGGNLLCFPKRKSSIISSSPAVPPLWPLLSFSSCFPAMSAWAALQLWQ